MEGSRFVDVPSDRLMGLLRVVGSKVTERGGSYRESTQGREVVVTFVPPKKVDVEALRKESYSVDSPNKDNGNKNGVCVRVYTSIANGSTAARGVGEDAIRLLIGYTENEGFRPLSKGRRLYRTAPQLDGRKFMSEDKRVETFLERLKVALREEYVEAMAWKICHVCGKVMAQRTNKATKSTFWGCTDFPKCKATQPA